MNAFLRAIMRDEVISWHKRQEAANPSSVQADLGGATGGVPGAAGGPAMEGEALISRVNKAVTAITARIQSLAASDTQDNKVRPNQRCSSSVCPSLM